MVRSAAATIAFELKCFVAGSDANKLDSFPRQIRRLDQNARNGNFAQGIGFATLYGYSNAETLCSALFPDARRTVGPLPLIEEHPLEFVIGEITGDELRPPAPGV